MNIFNFGIVQCYDSRCAEVVVTLIARIDEFWNSSIIRKIAATGSVTCRLKGINGDMLIYIKEEVIYYNYYGCTYIYIGTYSYISINSYYTIILSLVHVIILIRNISIEEYYIFLISSKVLLSN